MFWENIWNRQKKFFKVELMYNGKSQGSYCEPANKPLFFPLGGSGSDEEYRVSLVKMTDKKYKSLPEFAGF